MLCEGGKNAKVRDFTCPGECEIFYFIKRNLLKNVYVFFSLTRDIFSAFSDMNRPIVKEKLSTL